MRKRSKGPSSSTKRVMQSHKMDMLESQKMTEEQKKAWKRKPYDFGGEHEQTR